MEINPSTVHLEKLRKLAHDAHRHTSFDPEKRAEAIVRDYGQELRDDLQQIQKAYSAEPPTVLDVQVADYMAKYEKHLATWLHSHSRLASPMITGPANFPAERMRKYGQSADNKYAQFRGWRERALKAIVKSVTPKIDELTDARQRLEHREELQQKMVEANKIIRKGGPAVRDSLLNLNFSEGVVTEIMVNGFRSFQLQNNSSEIRRLRTRVTVLETKRQLAEINGEKTEIINGVKLVHNYEADRVQLIYEGKPDGETITRLKSRGFRWTPSQKAWQRKLTNQAIYDAKTIIGKGKTL